MFRTLKCQYFSIQTTAIFWTSFLVFMLVGVKYTILHYYKVKEGIVLINKTVGQVYLPTISLWIGFKLNSGIAVINYACECSEPWMLFQTFLVR
jgi:hypothetical protein